MRRPRPFAHPEAALLPAVVGVDEVGRGALAGPVVVAAVWFDPGAIPTDLLARLDDSKRLAAPERRAVAVALRPRVRLRFAARSARQIDRSDIRAATLAAMAAATRGLAIKGEVRVDGRDLPAGLDAGARAVIGGDGLVPQIAAASILAKVLRDDLMVALAGRYPAYGWAENAGYGTAGHRAAIRARGPCPHHRRSFGSLLGSFG